MKKSFSFLKDWLTSLQYYYSNTDPTILKSCSSKADLMQRSIGTTVMLSAAMATMGGVAFIHEAFDSFLVVLFGGVIWFLTIGNFDKSLFLGNSKMLLVARLIIIIGIAIPVSGVFKMQFLAKDIEHQLEVRYKEGNAKKYDQVSQVEGEFKAGVSKIDNEVFKLERELLEAKRLRDAEGSGIVYGGSSGEGGKGPKWKAYNKQAEVIQSRINGLENGKAKMEQDMIKDRTVAKGRVERSIVKRNHSFLARYIAFKSLLNHPDKEIREGTKEVHYSLTFLIILIEIFPVILKAFIGKTQYMKYVDEQEHLIVKAVKYRDKQMEGWIENIHDTPLAEDYTEEDMGERINTFNKIINNIKMGNNG
jgi:hypothetical protein